MTKTKTKKRALRRLALSLGASLLLCTAAACDKACGTTDPAVSGDKTDKTAIEGKLEEDFP